MLPEGIVEDLGPTAGTFHGRGGCETIRLHVGVTPRREKKMFCPNCLWVNDSPCVPLLASEVNL
ncbi:hypothetical protein C4571_01860 [Candidatus Parcubacteria bacterium]|nr:MAG: hypothetical protein C4571_01860 [Candidatus Parcubacteria bacterium]